MWHSDTKVPSTLPEYSGKLPIDSERALKSDFALKYPIADTLEKVRPNAGLLVG